MNRSRILVANDEAVIIKLLRANLEAEGWQVLIATDGAEALQTMKNESPDLVLLDIMMPRVDGFEVLRRFREWSQIPVIILSVREEMEDKVKCLNLGADDYITKPFGVEELIARVSAVLRRNKAAGSAWTWDEIDSLQAGLMLRRPVGLSSDESYCTQLYVEVKYTE